MFGGGEQREQSAPRATLGHSSLRGVKLGRRRRRVGGGGGGRAGFRKAGGFLKKLEAPTAKRVAG